MFDRFTDPEELRFDATEIPVSLAQMGDDYLTSRSQAKRLLARVTNFRRVILDFSGVEAIGPAFADESFRVFAADYPEIALEAANTAPDVDWMIRRARRGGNGRGSSSQRPSSGSTAEG